MEQSQQSQGGFSFGSVADTEYVSYEMIDTENKLPYHPFHFDLTLTVFRSKPPYEEAGTSFPLSRDKSIVFGRKKKTQAEWSDATSIPKYLNAQIISAKHFSINQHYIIKDSGSKKGTFLWVGRDRPKKIQSLDTYLVAKSPLVMNRVIHLPKPSIEMTYQDKVIRINDQKKVFLIGSH